MNIFIKFIPDRMVSYPRRK